MVSLVLAALLLGGLAIGLITYQWSERQRVRVETLIGSLRTASLDEVPSLAKLLTDQPGLAQPRLKLLRDSQDPASELALKATLTFRRRLSMYCPTLA